MYALYTLLQTAIIDEWQISITCELSRCRRHLGAVSISERECYLRQLETDCFEIFAILLRTSSNELIGKANNCYRALSETV